MQSPRTIALAVAWSVLIHLLVVAAMALALVLSPLLAIELPRPPVPEPDEITIAMPEILIPEPEEEIPDPLEDDDLLDPPPAPVSAPKGRRDIFRTTQNAREDRAPDHARFESDRNTTAASEAEASSAAPEADMPSQDGIDLPFLELAAREYTDGRLADDATKGEQGPEDPSPAAPPSSPVVAAPQQPSPLPPSDDPKEPIDSDGEADSPDLPDAPDTGSELIARATPPPMIEPLADLLFDPSDPIELPAPEPSTVPTDEPLTIREPMLDDTLAEVAPSPRRIDETTLTEVPTATLPPSEPRPLPGDPAIEDTDIFQPHTPKTHYRGGIGQKGRSAVNAVNAADTPLGRYGKAVTQAIERTWHLYRLNHSDFVTYATIRLSFQINKNGRPENLKILHNDANAIMTDFTLNAILDANIPSIPPGVADLLDEGKFNITYDVIVY
ncbi:hypothetical protein BH23VER1_BH23VER1_23130 [soil metagenome]